MANALTCAGPGTFFCLNVFSHVPHWNDEVAPQVLVCSFKCMTQTLHLGQVSFSLCVSSCLVKFDLVRYVLDSFYRHTFCRACGS